MKTARTRSIPFYSVSCAPALLSVQAGVEIDEAIEEAGNMLNAALWTLKGVACNLSVEDGGHEAWTAIYSLEIADAILHAVSAGLLGLERPEPDSKPEPAPAPEAKPEDPEAMRRIWADLAKMAADELAKLDEAKPAMSVDANSINPSHHYTAEPVSDGDWLWRLFDSATGAVVLYGLEASEDACHEAANKSAEQVGCTLLDTGETTEGEQ